MTVTPRRQRALSLSARTVAVLAAIAFAVVPLAVPAASGSTSLAAPAPTPTPSIPAGTTVFTLSPVGSGIVHPGDALAVSVTLQNATDAATAPIVIGLSLGTTALRDRDALRAWLAGDGSGISVEQVGTATIGAVPAGGEQTEGIGVGSDDPALQGLAPGVYPLVASYDTADGPVASTSVMIVPRPEAAVPVGIGVVVPITAGALSGGLLTADQLAALTAPTGSLSNQLNGVEGTPAILAVDPAIPASIRVLGTSAPASAVEWLDRLLELPHSRFALQFGDADVAAQLEAGLSRPAAPTSLTAYMNPALFPPAPESAEPTDPAEPTGSAPAPSPSPTTDPDADPDAPALPGLDALLDIGGARSAVYWPAAGTASGETVTTLGGLTVDDQRSLTLVPSDATAQGSTGATVPAHATVGDADVLVYDIDVSRALQEASVLDEGALRGAALTEATAHLAFATAETGGGPILAALDRDPERSRVGLRSAVSAATEAPGVAPVSLGGLAAAPSRTAEISDAAADPVRVASASALFADEHELSRFATILDDPSLITGPERAEILQLLGVAWIGDPTWATTVPTHRAESAGTLDSVGLMPTTTINLFGADAGLRFWVRNDLPYPVRLVLYAVPDDLRLDVQRANPVDATAQSNTRVDVPVQARVGNGEVTLALQLRSRASVAIGEPATVEVNVRAEWEAVGIAALAIVVGGLLAIGAIRTFLRLRARRANQSLSEPSETKRPEDPEARP